MRITYPLWQMGVIVIAMALTLLVGLSSNFTVGDRVFEIHPIEKEKRTSQSLGKLNISTTLAIIHTKKEGPNSTESLFFLFLALIIGI